MPDHQLGKEIQGADVNKGRYRRVRATFEVTDELLWEAVAGRLPLSAPLTLGRSGLIGPLVELAIGRMAAPEAYRGITIEPPIFRQIETALVDDMISGAGARDRAGVFPLGRFDPSNDHAENLLWEQWAKHAENAAVAVGLPKGLVAGLMGALGELQDNVFEHSGRSESGLVAYGAQHPRIRIRRCRRRTRRARKPPRKFRVQPPCRLWSGAAPRRLRWRLPPRLQHRTRLRDRSVVSRTRTSRRRVTISKWRPRSANLG